MEKLIINNLSKTYANGIAALTDVSLEIPYGVFGLLGPNGAGKSTLMRILATLQEPDAGTIQYGKINALTQKLALRKQLGYLPQQFGVYPKISLETLLHHLAILKGIANRKARQARIDFLLHQVNLYEVRKQSLASFSGGMKQRFGIAQALLNEPKLLIVDEPTAGLDPAERNRFFNLLSEVGERSIVILSTHIVEDVKALCAGMAILYKGRVLVQGNPIALMEALQGKLFEKKIAKAEREQYQRDYQVIHERLFLGEPIIRVLSTEHPRNGFVAVTANLEDSYLAQINNA
ncbi:MAG: ABC transporter ATP-binding protein [Saprospiraceae bacterium]